MIEVNISINRDKHICSIIISRVSQDKSFTTYHYEMTKEGYSHSGSFSVIETTLITPEYLLFRALGEIYHD